VRPDTAELLFQLDEPTRSQRERALLQLAAAPDSEATGELLRFAARAGRVGDERALAFRAVANCLSPGDDAAVAFLLRRRDDEDPFVRLAVLDGLSRVDDPRLGVVFRKALGDPHPQVREAAHRALYRPDTAPALGPRAEASEAPSVAARVRGALARLTAPGNAASEEAAAELLTLGSAAVGALLLELQHPVPGVRSVVARLLGQIGDRRALAALVSRLPPAGPEQDREVLPVLLRAVAALAAPDERGLADRLLPFVRGGGPGDGDPFVRAAALVALGRLGDRRAAPDLIAALGDGEAWLRETAAQALPEAITGPAPELMPALVAQLLRSSEPVVVVALLLTLRAAWAPGLSPGPQLLPRLAELLADVDPTVREAAVLAADALLVPADDESAPLPTPLLDALLARAADPVAAVRRGALALLADVVPARHPAAGALARSLALSADPEVHRPALRMLARVGDFESVEALLRLARAPEGPQAALARRLLDELEGPLRLVEGDGGALALHLEVACACGAAPQPRRDARGRETYHCGACGRDSLLLGDATLVPLDELPHGACRCCPRPSPLRPSSDGRLVCPASGQQYLRHPATGAVYRFASLPYGGCACCRPAAPLEEQGARVVCPATGRVHVLDPQQGYRLEQPTSPSGPSVDDVNRALLEGSLLLTQSGLPDADDEDD